MKNLKKLLVVGAAMATASAYAGYTFDSTTPIGLGGTTSTVGPVTGNGTSDSPYLVGNTQLGSISGTTTFDLNVVGSGSNQKLTFAVSDVYETGNGNQSALDASLFSINNISVKGLTGAFSSENNVWATSIGDGINSQGTYVVTVGWTLTGGYAQYPSWLSTFDMNVSSSLPGKNNSTGADAYLTAVPEPSQMIAGGLLLGCGGLVFLGRRMMKKQA